VICGGPSAGLVAHADSRLELEKGQTARSTLGINNPCSTPHHYLVKSELKYLSFEQPAEPMLIEANATRRLGAEFDAMSAESRVYRSKVGVHCLDCTVELGCERGRDEMAVEMAVVKRTAAGARWTDDPQLTLNKHHEPNPGQTTWQIGVPITYVVTVSNSGGASSNVTVTDTLPSGFVFINGTCTATFGATCQNPTLPSPTGGVLTIPALTIPQGGNIEIRITGYFNTSGPKDNLAEARAGSLPVGNATSHDPLVVPADPLPGNLQWLPPDYSPKFGTVTLSGECCQEVRVLNQAHQCCTPAKATGRKTVPNLRSSAQHRKLPARRVNRR
jgi:uncharacterized repeat protein (TIGR01451 family)